MDKLIVRGGRKLIGGTSVSGAKNVALKALVAACLTDEEVTIKNIPLISDFMVMTGIIKELGGDVRIKDHTVCIRVKRFKKERIALEEGAKIRTSAMLMSPLLVRNGRAIIPNPGGCRIGARPIDRTIRGLRKMGVSTVYNSRDGYFYLRKDHKIKDQVTYTFGKTTHTGTETLILKAAISNFKTILKNTALEPEVDELIALLNKMGARIKRAAPRTIVIEGVNKLHGTTFVIGPDRNEIVTFAIAGIATKGDVFVKGAQSANLSDFLEKLDKCGGGFEKKKGGIRFYYKGALKSTSVTTSPFPGFMTDWQGPWAVLMALAKGESIVHETVYENRFGYINELRRMGADISLFNPKVENPEKVYNFSLSDNKREYFHAARIKGPTGLHNAVVNISDLRAGATLVIAALIASNKSVIFGVEHLDRGYEKFEERLKALGADIKRLKDE